MTRRSRRLEFVQPMHLDQTYVGLSNDDPHRCITLTEVPLLWKKKPPTMRAGGKQKSHWDFFNKSSSRTESTTTLSSDWGDSNFDVGDMMMDNVGNEPKKQFDHNELTQSSSKQQQHTSSVCSETTIAMARQLPQRNHHCHPRDTQAVSGHAARADAGTQATSLRVPVKRKSDSLTALHTHHLHSNMVNDQTTNVDVQVPQQLSVMMDESIRKQQQQPPAKMKQSAAAAFMKAFLKKKQSSAATRTTKQSGVEAVGTNRIMNVKKDDRPIDEDNNNPLLTAVVQPSATTDGSDSADADAATATVVCTTTIVVDPEIPSTSHGGVVNMKPHAKKEPPPKEGNQRQSTKRVLRSRSRDMNRRDTNIRRIGPEHDPTHQQLITQLARALEEQLQHKSHAHIQLITQGVLAFPTLGDFECVARTLHMPPHRVQNFYYQQLYIQEEEELHQEQQQSPTSRRPQQGRMKERGRRCIHRRIDQWRAAATSNLLQNQPQPQLSTNAHQRPSRNNES